MQYLLILKFLYELWMELMSAQRVFGQTGPETVRPSDWVEQAVRRAVDSVTVKNEGFGALSDIPWEKLIPHIVAIIKILFGIDDVIG